MEIIEARVWMARSGADTRPDYQGEKFVLDFKSNGESTKDLNEKWCDDNRAFTGEVLN